MRANILPLLPMKKKRYLYGLTLLVLVAINVYILYNRNNGYKYFPFKAYTQLYVTDSTLYLCDLKFSVNSLQLIFSLPLSPKGYTLNTAVSPLIFPKGNTITMPIKEGKQEYVLTPIDTLATGIKINADHFPSAGTPANGYINELTYCNLPGPQIQVSALSTWKKGAEALSAEDLANGIQLLRTKTNAFSAKTDSERVMEIAKFVAALPSDSPGTTPLPQAPYQQIVLAQANKAKLVCGNYSDIIHYLCDVLRMPNRIVTYQGPAGNWQYGAHYLNEIYLRDKQQWVVADGMSNIYVPHDSLRYYNLADIKKMQAVNGFGNKYAYSLIKNSMQLLSYGGINEWQVYYSASNANLCFMHPGTNLYGNAWQNLKEFYSFSSNVEFYSDVNTNNWLKIFIKMVAFVALIATLAVYIFEEIRNI